jgi:predicted RNA-binding protein YlxR (DUF448 family)/ribosomal protein L30E
MEALTLIADLDDDDDAGPTRRCVASGERLEKSALIRFVASPDGVVTPDLEARLPGRGLYVRAREVELALAVKKNLFSRAAKRSLRLPDDLTERVGRLLLERVQGCLGMARRGGAAVAGYDQVSEALRHGKAHLLIQASDGSPDPRRRLATLATGLPVIEPLTAEALGAPFGRDRLVHLAICGKSIAAALQAASNRLVGFRTPLQEQHAT